MKNFLTSFLILAGIYTAYSAVVAPGSSAIGSNPLSGYVLQTNGATSTWVATSSLGFASAGSGSPNIVYVDGTTYAYTGAGIQAAVNVICGLGGGKVQLTPAVYPVSSQITLCSNLVLEGFGTSTTLRPQSNFFTLFIDADANVIVRNISIDGADNTVSSGATAIRIKNSYNVHVEKNVLINNTAFGVFVDASGVSTSSRVWIEDNYIEGEGTNDVIGGGPQNSTGATVQDIYVLNNNVIQDCTVGTYCNAFDLVAEKNFVIQGNIFYGIVQPGSEQFPHTNVNISNNLIFPAVGKQTTALYISTNELSTASSSNINISNNTIASGTIEIFGTSTAYVLNTNVVGNIINVGALQDGITFQYATGGTVQDNTIIGGESGIEFATSSNFTVGGNTVSDANFGVKVDSTTNTITVGVNRFDNILNQYVVGVPGVNIIRSGGTQTADLAVRDSTYDFDPTGGKFYFSNFNDRFGIYRGVAGINGNVKMEIDASKVTFGDWVVRGKTLGVFAGPNVMSFPISGDVFVNNQGNFVIGTSTPFAKFAVQGTFGSSTALFDVASTTSSSFATTSLFRILSSGFVGVGTSTPSEKVDIWGNLNVGTSSIPVFFANSGTKRAGINTNTPASFLSIVGTSSLSNTNTTDILVLERPFNSGVFRGKRASLNVGAADTVSDGPSKLDFKLALTGVPSLTDTTLPGVTVMSLLGNGVVGIGSSTPAGSSLVITGSSTLNPLSISSSTGSTLFSILANGNVGVGTSTPLQAFHVVVPSGTVRSRVQSGLVTTDLLASSAASRGYVGTASNHTFAIRTADTDRVLIGTTGNVGIATTSPGALLTVADGDVYIASSTRGLIFKDTATLACVRLQITNGAFATSSVTCP